MDMYGDSRLTWMAKALRVRWLEYVNGMQEKKTYEESADGSGRKEGKMGSNKKYVVGNSEKNCMSFQI